MQNNHPASPGAPASDIVQTRIGLLLGLLAVITGLLICTFFSYSREVTTQNRTLLLKDGSSIRVRLHAPRRRQGSLRGVIVSHGMACNKEMMDIFSMEIARNGKVVLTPDFTTDDSDRNTALIRMLIPHLLAETGGTETALVGHSLGALEVVEAAYREPSVRATVAFGLYIGGELNLPQRNLLLGTGFYDRIFPSGERIASLRSVTDGKCQQPGILWGSFQDFSARKLFISPVSQHSSEIIDVRILAETIRWLREAFEETTPVKPLIFFWNFPGTWILYLGIFLVCLHAPLIIAPGRGRALPAKASLFVLLLTAGLVFAGLMDGSLGVIIVVALFYSLVWGNYVAAASHSPSRSTTVHVVKIALFIIILIASLALSEFIFERSLRAHDPLLTRAWPAYFFTSHVAYPLFTIQSNFRHLIDCSAPMGAFFVCCIVGLMLLELKKPGVIGNWIVKRWGYCTQLKKVKEIHPTKCIAAAVLLMLAIIAWWYFLSQVRLTPHMINYTGRDVLKYFLLPGVATAVLCRMLFRRL